MRPRPVRLAKCPLSLRGGAHGEVHRPVHACVGLFSSPGLPSTDITPAGTCRVISRLGLSFASGTASDSPPLFLGAGFHSSLKNRPGRVRRGGSIGPSRVGAPAGAPLLLFAAGPFAADCAP